MTRAVLLAAALLLTLSACNTTRGVGQDVEVLGVEIQDATQ